jgi:outer membrane cobalamin receptor
LPSGLHAHASYGTAFKAPSFNELYYPGFSNPDLRPEEAKTAELGVRGTAVGVRWNLTAYRSDIDQLVAFDVATFLPQNIARAQLTGVEGGATWQRGAWRLEQTLSWLEAEDQGAGATVAARCRGVRSGPGAARSGGAGDAPISRRVCSSPDGGMMTWRTRASWAGTPWST